MLPKHNEKEDKKFAIPPKAKLLYEDFKLVAETSTYRVFNARARASREWHTIRVLDCTTEYAKANGDHAATLFVQELLWLQQRYAGSVFTNTFEISENGNQMACATLSYLPLSCQLSEDEEIINPKDSKVVGKLVSDILVDVEFLWKDLQLRKILDALSPENISYIKEKDSFFLGNWAKVYEIAQLESKNLSATTTYVTEATKNKKINFQDLAEEIKALAFAILKTNKVDYTGLQSLLAIPNLETSVYNFAVQSLLAKSFPDSEKLRSLIGKMLSTDLQNLPNLEELRIKEERTQHSFNPSDEESKQLQVGKQSGSSIIQSTIIGIILTILIVFRNNHPHDSIQ
mgnify:CR=1 FL=1